jgi:uncharacterized phage protein (TIGR02218 family)
MEVVRVDAYALRYCTGTSPVTIDAVEYSPLIGATFSSMASSVGLTVDNHHVTIGDSEEVLREDILDGVWSGARYRFFQYDQLQPAAGVIPWSSGFIGEVDPLVAAFDFEALDLRHALFQDASRVFQFGCINELGDARCRIDLAGWTIAGLAVTVATNNQTFTTDLAEAADWATNGRLLFTTGSNANGIWRKVTLHAGGGVLTLDRATVYPVAVADEFTIVTGCQHRPDEDCRDKFANKVNNGGCDTKPTVSDLASGRLESE